MDALLELFKSVKTCGQLADFIKDTIKNKTVNACGEHDVHVFAIRKAYQVIIGHELLTFNLETSSRTFSASLTERFINHTTTKYTFGREEYIHLTGHGYEKLILSLDDLLKEILYGKCAA
jgi:hypothetical protein